MVFLRETTIKDVDLLFGWANDSAVRENLFTAEQIPYDEHLLWHRHVLKDESIFQYILVDGGVPIGQIRLNPDGESATMNYGISAKRRGKAYGHLILQLVTDEVRANHLGIIALKVLVKDGNVVSVKLLESEGYRLTDLHYYLKNVSGEDGPLSSTCAIPNANN
ncbi:MAG: GNAT family N-acetyltransferase [Atopobiaceae bacterium]|nr:GNAT family N-acetyltransferase [Atopobiaceae bacterium]